MMQKLPKFVLKHLARFFFWIGRHCFAYLGDCDICAGGDSHIDSGKEN